MTPGDRSPPPTNRKIPTQARELILDASPYQKLKSAIEEIKALAEAGQWDAAALLASRLQPEGLPAATPADRNAIETALAAVASIDETAVTLHGQTSRLLAAFSTPKSKAP